MRDYHEVIKEYLDTWKIADAEKKETGKVGRKTEKKLIELEAEIQKYE